MSKLNILIPQYNEDENMIKPLLDSIQMQQNINNNDFEVIIGNDGSDTKLSVDFLKQYTFRIQYHFFKHGRLAATRQKLLNLATGDYVMFCDADDRFINTIAFSMILNEMQTSFDILICDFFAEIPIDGIMKYKLYHDDPIFVHGKVYNRQFLLNNEIVWHPELHEHQDSAFTILARTCAKRTGICSTPLYLWAHNANSICRKDQELHLPHTWVHMIDSYDCLVKDLQERNYGKQAAYYAKYGLYATYFEISRDVWKLDKVQQNKFQTLQRLYDFYNKYRLLIKTVPEKETQKIIETTQRITKAKGHLNEMPPFDEWLQSILTLFKG